MASKTPWYAKTNPTNSLASRIFSLILGIVGIIFGLILAFGVGIWQGYILLLGGGAMLIQGVYGFMKAKK